MFELIQFITCAGITEATVDFFLALHTFPIEKRCEELQKPLYSRILMAFASSGVTRLPDHLLQDPDFFEIEEAQNFVRFRDQVGIQNIR